MVAVSLRIFSLQGGKKGDWGRSRMTTLQPVERGDRNSAPWQRLNYRAQPSRTCIKGSAEQDLCLNGCDREANRLLPMLINEYLFMIGNFGWVPVQIIMAR
jgi:hypothetical protein